MEPVQAREMLLDIISEFPFATEAHRSAWIAALITLVARHAFIGNSPVFLADGNCPGIGKGLATDLLTMIVEGRKACRHTFPGDNDELRKLITSIVMSGAPYCLFDNIKGHFGGQAIENALTSGRWKDRLLGVNREIDIPLQLVWLATSNNATLTKDMPRRTCHIRLETDLEHPETRSDFKYPNLLEYVKRYRRQLVMAALSIPAAYIQAARPDQHLTEWASFEGWSALVRSSIVWAGLADPDTRVALGEIADEETSTLHQLVHAWEECFGNAFGTVGDAITSAETGQAQQLNELLNDLPGDKRRTLGTLLRDGKSRVLDGRKIERADGKRAKWRIVPVQGVSA
jgi:putative DNA primase/helicase